MLVMLSRLKMFQLIKVVCVVISTYYELIPL